MLVSLLPALARAQMGEQPQHRPASAIHFIYLVRHAWYDSNDPRDPRVGMELDSLGRAQAALTAGRLARGPFHVHALVSSTFTRALQTAAIIGDSLHLPVVRDSAFCECSPPSYRQDYVPARDPTARQRCLERLEDAWRRWFTPAAAGADVYDVIVAHGNVIRWLTSKALHLDTQRWPDYDIANCSITVIQVRSDSTTRLAVFSDAGHLPPAMQTWTGRGAGWSPPEPPMPPVLGGRPHRRD